MSVTIADGSYSVLPIVVTMSEPVTVDTTNGTPSISVTISGTVRDATYQVPADPSVASATLNFSYTAVNENDDDGIDDMGTTLSLNSGVIQDGASNALPDSSSFTKPTNLASVFIDTTAPSISSVTVTGQNYDTDANIDISVVFDENVTVIGSPTLGLTIGADARTASYESGSGSATLIFRYTVVSGDSDTDGIEVSPTTISLSNSATIQDGANNDAALELASYLPTDLGLVTVNVPAPPTDTEAPSIMSVTIADGSYSVLTYCGDNE